jgi:M6 family metalloprotease-like protein
MPGGWNSCWFDSTGAVSEAVVEIWDFSNGALPTLYPLPTGKPANLNLLNAPDESDEDLCRITQLPESIYEWNNFSTGPGYTGFPVNFNGKLNPDQNVRIATIPVDWDDHEGKLEDLPAKHKHVQIFIDYYERASQGAVTFTPTFADDWYRLPEPISDYPQPQVSDFNPKLAQHGVDAADDDLDFSKIDIVVFIFPDSSPIISGYPPSPTEHASIQHFNAGIGPEDYRYVLSDEGLVQNYMGGGLYFEHPLRPVWSYYFHEAAHMFAMPDWYLMVANAVLGTGTEPELNLDYAAGPMNVWGVMSTQDGPSRTFVAWTRWLLGWLNDEQVDCYTLEQVQQHGAFDTELVALDIYEPGTKAIIIRTGEHSGFLIESRRPVFPDDYIVIWEGVGRDPYGLIVYEIDTTKPGATGTLSLVTPDGHDFQYMQLHGRQQPKMIDALFNVGNTATVQGVEIELLFTGDRDWVRISK